MLHRVPLLSESLSKPANGSSAYAPSGTSTSAPGGAPTGDEALEEHKTTDGQEGEIGQGGRMLTTRNLRSEAGAACHPPLRSRRKSLRGRTIARVGPTVSVRSCRYRVLRQSGKHRRTASRSGPGALPTQGHKPVLAFDDARVRLARSHVRTGFTERLRPTTSRMVQWIPVQLEGLNKGMEAGQPTVGLL